MDLFFGGYLERRIDMFINSSTLLDKFNESKNKIVTEGLTSHMS